MVRVKEYFAQCKNRLLNDEEGAVSILSVILLAVVIGFLFFLIFDYGTYMEKRQQLQHFADNAASAVAMQGDTIWYPVDVIKQDCIEEDENGNPRKYNCDYVLEDSRIVFDSENKRKQIEDGIAHQMARKEFHLDSAMKPTSMDPSIKDFRMTVDVLDRIDSDTEIKTEMGTYNVKNPTVVVKVWADVEGPFLKKELEMITVGVFESKERPN